MSINADAAMYGTSYGAFQIMGFHYQDAGFKSLKEFVDAQSTMSGQVESFITFIANNQVLLKAMKTKNFTEFAKNYNGKEYKDNKYDTQLQQKYDAITKQ